MSDLDRMKELDALRDLSAPVPPPLGDELEAELAALTPVKTRRPLRDFAKVVILSLVYGAAILGMVTLRRDMHGLPVWWLVVHGAAWFLGFIVMAYLAIVPRRGTMMPRWRLVGIGAVLVSLGFVAAGLLMKPMSAETLSTGLRPPDHPPGCLEIGVSAALVPIILGALVLRGAVPVGSRWTAAGLGAAGGSLGGLVLHLHCPIGDGLHLGIIHGGVVVASALLAAALVPRFTR